MKKIAIVIGITICLSTATCKGQINIKGEWHTSSSSQDSIFLDKGGYRFVSSMATWLKDEHYIRIYESQDTIYYFDFLEDNKLKVEYVIKDTKVIKRDKPDTVMQRFVIDTVFDSLSDQKKGDTVCFTKIIDTMEFSTSFWDNENGHWKFTDSKCIMIEDTKNYNGVFIVKILDDRKRLLIRKK